MNLFLNKLKTSVLVCDGAMGTMLQKSGLPTGYCPEEWNVSNPEKVSQTEKEKSSRTEAGIPKIKAASS